MTDVSPLLLAALSAAPSHEHAEYELHNADWYTVGRGSFAVVFGHNAHLDRVIKVVRCLDDGSLPFTAMAMEKWKTNPHYPRIYRAGISGSWYWCEMERLESIARRSTNLPMTDQHEMERQRVASWRRLCGGIMRDHSPPALVTLCEEVREQIAGRYEVDLHDDNAMARVDGDVCTLVITDPFSYVRTGEAAMPTPTFISTNPITSN